jgi:hypothetical protein
VLVGIFSYLGWVQETGVPKTRRRVSWDNAMWAEVLPLLLPPPSSSFLLPPSSPSSSSLLLPPSPSFSLLLPPPSYLPLD